MDTDDSAALVTAIQAGDLPALARMLEEQPSLASSRIGGDQAARTPLHVVADWPGYFPNGAQVVQLLVAAGADPDARFAGPQFAETPLHWAASSDDTDVARALIDAGADIDAPRGSIGTPLANAVGYGCWNVAHLLVARGAVVDALWHASALGMLTRIDELARGAGVTNEMLSQAFWHACAGGQRRAAEDLLARGADPAWIPRYASQSALEMAGARGTQRDNLVAWLRERTTK